MILNQQDTSILICKGSYQAIETSNVNKEVNVVGHSAIYLGDKVVSPNGIASDSILTDSVSKADFSNFSKVRFKSKYVKKYLNGEYAYYIQEYIQDFEYSAGMSFLVKVNAKTIDTDQTLIEYDSETGVLSILVRCDKSILNEYNNLELYVLDHSIEILPYGWYYEFEDMSDEDILEYDDIDVKDFTITEENTDPILSSHYNDVDSKVDVDKKIKITFSEYKSDSSIYSQLGEVGDNLRYSIARILFNEDDYSIEKYVDCVLESKEESINSDVDLYLYEFTGRLISITEPQDEPMLTLLHSEMYDSDPFGTIYIGCEIPTGTEVPLTCTLKISQADNPTILYSEPIVNGDFFLFPPDTDVYYNIIVSEDASGGLLQYLLNSGFDVGIDGNITVNVEIYNVDKAISNPVEFVCTIS